MVSDSVKFVNSGLVETKKDGVSTSNPRVFAGGDIVRGPALVVDAVADGRIAGQKIVKLLQKTYKARQTAEKGKK
jgi:NADPH-dependent glutamate synthase beta subunit-like oxidoreductase